MFLNPSDCLFIFVVLLLAWMIISNIDGGGGGKRARIPIAI